MMPFAAFKKLLSIIDGTRSRETQEHMEFLEFFQQLVGSTSLETAKEFGKIKVPTIVKGSLQEGYMIELTTTDVLWWQSIIIKDGGRFQDTVASVQRDIWDQLGRLIRQRYLHQGDQSELLELSMVLNMETKALLTG